MEVGEEEEKDNEDEEKKDEDEEKKDEDKEKQVAQGQYVVSDTCCPALHG